jgi:hypothetical protein
MNKRMTCRNYLLAGGLVGILMSTPASGGTGTGGYVTTGSDLLEFCTSTDWQMQMYCLAYVQGVGDTMAGGEPVNGFISACIPAGVSTGQEKEIAVSYLRAHANIRQNNGAALVAAALAGAFPCS